MSTFCLTAVLMNVAMISRYPLFLITTASVVVLRCGNFVATYGAITFTSHLTRTDYYIRYMLVYFYY